MFGCFGLIHLGNQRECGQMGALGVCLVSLKKQFSHSCTFC